MNTLLNIGLIAVLFTALEVICFAVLREAFRDKEEK